MRGCAPTPPPCPRGDTARRQPSGSQRARPRQTPGTLMHPGLNLPASGAAGRKRLSEKPPGIVPQQPGRAELGPETAGGRSLYQDTYVATHRDSGHHVGGGKPCAPNIKLPLSVLNPPRKSEPGKP